MATWLVLVLTSENNSTFTRQVINYETTNIY
jgi:hypothetical protein